MGVNFGNNVTQTLPPSSIQMVISNFDTITSYSGHSGTWFRMWSGSFSPKLANSRIKLMLEIHGYMSAGNADNNYQIGYRINGGTSYFIGGNPNNASGNGGTCIHGNHRGSDWCTNSFVTEWTNVWTGGSSGHGSWSAGNTLEFWVDRMGEGTFYVNQGSSTGAVRFGRGRSKIIIEEFVT